MIAFTCDRCGERCLPCEVTTLTLRGPARTAFNRTAMHTCKLCMYDLSEWFSIPLARPEHLPDDLARRRSLELGTPANSKPPMPRERKSAQDLD